MKNKKPLPVYRTESGKIGMDLCSRCISISKLTRQNADSQDVFDSVFCRQQGQTVSHFSCGFVQSVYELTSKPIDIDDLCRLTDSSRDRVRLALHDLSASGVVFEVRQ